jgi:hypothetical protein
MISAAIALMMAPLAADTGQLLVLDISAAESAEVSALKSSAGPGWWLELGDRMVLVGGGRSAARQLQVPVLTQIQGIDPERLALRARGCSEHAREAGTLITRGARWELRLLEANESMPEEPEHDSGWRRVTPDTVVARQYRLDAGDQVVGADPQVQAVVDAITPARWFADVQTLSGWDRSSYATTSLSAARDWIGSQFGALGLSVSTPTFTMPSSAGTITRNNVIGTWIGTATPDEWVVVGAHYDSRNSSSSSTTSTPGAEDNASGCAGVIEIARALLPTQPTRSVLFMCYAGEEQGLIGSAAHVQALTQSGDLPKVQSVVIMDMVGYSSDGQLQALYESRAEHLAYMQRFGAAAATYVPQLDVIYSTNPFGSDHMPYLNVGVQTLLAIEADWDLYPHYHRSTDTAANIGPHAQAMGGAILKTNAAVLTDLVGRTTAGFSDGFE